LIFHSQRPFDPQMMWPTLVLSWPRRAIWPYVIVRVFLFSSLLTKICGGMDPPCFSLPLPVVRSSLLSFLSRSEAYHTLGRVFFAERPERRIRPLWLHSLCANRFFWIPVSVVGSSPLFFTALVCSSVSVKTFHACFSRARGCAGNKLFTSRLRLLLLPTSIPVADAGARVLGWLFDRDHFDRGLCPAVCSHKPGEAEAAPDECIGGVGHGFPSLLTISVFFAFFVRDHRVTTPVLIPSGLLGSLPCCCAPLWLFLDPVSCFLVPTPLAVGPRFDRFEFFAPPSSPVSVNIFFAPWLLAMVPTLFLHRPRRSKFFFFCLTPSPLLLGTVPPSPFPSSLS